MFELRNFGKIIDNGQQIGSWERIGQYLKILAVINHEYHNPYDMCESLIKKTGLEVTTYTVDTYFKNELLNYILFYIKVDNFKNKKVVSYNEVSNILKGNFC